MESNGEIKPGDFADNLSILDENISKIDELLEVYKFKLQE